MGSQFSNFVLFAILAWLLSPEDFGILGIASVWLAFLGVLSELGFGVALIQKKEIDAGHLSSMFFLNLIMGVVLSLLGVALSWPLALIYKIPQVQPIVAALSIGFFIRSLSLTQVALAQREFLFRDLAIREISSSLLGGVVGVIMAFLGYGVWSLVAQSLISNVVGSVLIWYLMSWRPRLDEFSWDRLKEMWGYGSKIFFYQIFKYFVQNTDKLLIGYILGPVSLGVYTFVYKLIIVPFTGIRSAIGGYLFPKFSSLQESRDKVKASYLFFTKAIFSILTPLVIISGVFLPMIIPLIYGQKWTSAVPLFPAFTVIAIAQFLIAPVGELMKALDRPGWLLKWSVFFTILTTTSLLLGSFWGIIGASVGLAFAHILAFPIIYVIAKRLISVDIKSTIKLILPGSISIMLTIFFLIACTFLLREFSQIFKITIGVIFGCAIYMSVLFSIDKLFVLSILRRIAKNDTKLH